ncbi:MAG TPA: DNA recombination protein RmuC [Stellaceae bacterium]|nr:DNA recombination protein RmuC [Stellaceae bacterium]
MTVEPLILASVALSALAVVLCVGILYRSARTFATLPPLLEQRLLRLEAAISGSDAVIRHEFGRDRDETREASRSLREEIVGLFDRLTTSLRASLNDLSLGQQGRLDAFAVRLNEAGIAATENARNLREEIQINLKQLAEAVGARIGELTAVQADKLDSVTVQITTLTERNEHHQESLRSGIEARLGDLTTEAGLSAKALREEVTVSLQSLGSRLAETIDQISQSQQERLDRVSASVTELTHRTGEQYEAVRKTVEQRLDALRGENTEKLEQMRQTVDEKLQSTLDQRLGASFQIVADRLEQVYRSMGEMQSLASGVGDLKRLLTNVKSRGTWGEVALGNVLEEMMAPDQFGRNVEIVPGSNQRVEYAIRLPGDGDVPVWLPVDAKFPAEDYERLVDASQRGDVDAVEIAAKAIEAVIRGSARTICEKYIHSPQSTDFAVLFLPTEGLFAEVVRRPGLVDALQREWHIMVAGPTTLVSLLVSLRVGFRSLAIQKHSNEVWKVLAAVKTEFRKFGGILDKVGRKLRETQEVLEGEAGVRRRAMDRKLREIEVLPEAEAVGVLELEGPGINAFNEEAREAAE